jgi:preprotein translocase subunit YajC
MDKLFNLLPLSQAAAGAGNSTGQLVSTFVTFGLVIVIFYFLIIRPQSKKQKETEKMLSALKKGDHVLTVGGIYGVVQSVKEKTVIVKVDETTKLEFSRASISAIVNQIEEKQEKPAKESKKSKETKIASEDVEKPSEIEEKK